MDTERIPEKIYQYLLHLYDTRTTRAEHEFLQHSEVQVYKKAGLLEFPDSMIIIVDPEIYKKYHSGMDHYKASIVHNYTKVSGRRVGVVQVFPDLNKFQILNNAITPIITPWEEINSLQKNLILQLRKAAETTDFQNIGNTGRTILQKLSDIVFNPEKHIPPSGLDVSSGKFKNRLHTYIKAQLAEKQYEELREYTAAVITTAEKSVDLANKLTHDLKASIIMAESCVISVVTVVGLIKLIHR